ncbi:hypothetical protein N7504_010129 [Penicillium tannophilum]|nr:hypothetical protein N7504_010129 [Penicillium tannophilum]
MAISSGAVPGRRPLKSSSIALMSVFGVIGGTCLMFRLMAPQRGTVLTTNEELEAFRGGCYDQTSAHGKTARAPRATAVAPPAQK